MNVKNVLAFTAGLLIGATGATLYLKDKFAQIAQEEIEAVREVYAGEDKTSKEAVENEEEGEPKTSLKSDLTKHQTIAGEAGYTNYNEVSEKPAKNKTKNTKKKDIEYIPSTEYGDQMDYDAICLTLYSDDVIADDDDSVMTPDEVCNAIGKDFEKHFSDSDALYVKNNKLRCYYEVVKDSRTYSDVVGR